MPGDDGHDDASRPAKAFGPRRPAKAFRPRRPAKPAAGPRRPAKAFRPRRPANPAAAPGSSGPGEHGYGGAATVGDEGAEAGPEAYQDPFGRPDDPIPPN